MDGNNANRSKIMHMFIKMSSKWFCKKDISLFSESSNIQSHIENGELVVLADDVLKVGMAMQTSDALAKTSNAKDLNYLKWWVSASGDRSRWI